MDASIHDPATAQAFEAVSPAVRKRLLAIRALIRAVASTTDGVGELAETLQWGEPAYLTTQSRIGSSIRLGCPKSQPDHCAVYFNCNTNLVDTFRSLFPHELRFEGNRAIVFAPGKRIDKQALAVCFGAALTYHRDSRRNKQSSGAAHGACLWRSQAQRPHVPLKTRRQRGEPDHTHTLSMRCLLTTVLTIGLATVIPAAQAIEEPRYTVERQYDNFELRSYAPVLVAEVTVAGPADDAGNQGFRILAGYIFGKNKGEREIAMTAPVTQTPEPTKIAMTAPVTQAAADGGYTVQFTMPATFKLATLPEPLDARIRLKEIPGKRYAVIRYSGFWSDANYNSHLDKLERAVTAAGVATTGAPVYARYDAPWVPWFARRNEIWLHVP